jgi:hypothetical protein
LRGDFDSISSECNFQISVSKQACQRPQQPIADTLSEY